MHEYGYTIERTTDGVVVRDPGGAVVTAHWHVPARHWRAPALPPGATSTINLPSWDGTPPDYARAVDTLLPAHAR